MSEWISIKDRLPGLECVDVYAKWQEGEGRITDSFYDQQKKAWWKWDKECVIKLYYSDFVEVTHWMPLPEPPNET